MAHSGGRFTFVLRLSVLALAAPRLQLEEEHEASQNFIVNDTSGQTRPRPSFAERSPIRPP